LLVVFFSRLDEKGSCIFFGQDQKKGKERKGAKEREDYGGERIKLGIGTNAAKRTWLGGMAGEKKGSKRTKMTGSEGRGEERNRFDLKKETN